MAGMTKRHYVMIAETLNTTRRVYATLANEDEANGALNAIDQVASDLADAFQRDSPSFQRGWFMAIAGAVHCEACGDKLDSYGRGHKFLSDSNADGDQCPCTQSGKHVPSEPL